MNKELEEKLLSEPSLMGYRSLVKAIMMCDKQVKDEINNNYNQIISNLDSGPL